MNKDLISRQDAIDALEREKTYCNAYKEGYSQIDVFKEYNMGLTDGIKAIKGLPSIQPELGKNSPSEQHKMDKLGLKAEETCTDIISRQVTIDAFLTELTRRERNNLLHTWTTVEVKYFITKMLENLPSAQQERKKGFWFTLKKGDKGYSAGDFKCSVCGEPNHTCLPKPKFCSNCGADMSIYEEPIKISVGIN